jgi:polyisoprenyl-phosphate glycosyltransferase
MDADLQDPPEVVLEMIAKWKQGYDVVSTEGKAGSSARRPTSPSPHGRLGDVSTPRNAGDFHLVDRRALDCFLAMPERDRLVRGMLAWIGFRQGTVTFDRPPRAAGISKYSLRKMIGLAANGIISFSDAPLRLALWAGAAVSALAFIYGLSVIGRWLFGDPSLERGWSSTIVIIAALGGANMLMTGVIGSMSGAFMPRRRAGRFILSSAQ